MFNIPFETKARIYCVGNASDGTIHILPFLRMVNLRPHNSFTNFFVVFVFRFFIHFDFRSFPISVKRSFFFCFFFDPCWAKLITMVVNFVWALRVYAVMNENKKKQCESTQMKRFRSNLINLPNGRYQNIYIFCQSNKFNKLT